MAEKKNGDDVEAKIDDIARGLKELLANKEEESPSAADKPAAKKPAAKKPAAKKPAASKSAASTAKKPAAKKPAAKPAASKSTASTAKKPAAKKTEPEAVAEGVTVNQTSDASTQQPIIQVIVQAPAAAPAVEPQKAEEQPAPAPAEEPQAEAPAPVEEQKAEEQPEPAPVEEPKAEEQPAPAPAEEPKAEAAATTTTTVTTTVTTTKKQSALQKVHEFINNKGKLPLFIIINALFLLSAILLMFNSFYFELDGVRYNYNIFQYMGNSDVVKASLLSQSGQWVNGGYTMLGILMFIAMLVPLALLIKNIVLLAIKKRKDVYGFDAIVYFAAMMFFIAMVNIFGAYLSFGQVFSLIISAIIFVFTVFTLLLSGSAKRVPIFSIANVVLAFIAILLLSSKVYGGSDGTNDYSWYAAAAAGSFKAGGFMFLMLFIAVCALVLLVILQIKRFPGAVGHIVEIVVPLAAAVCAIIALIVAGANKAAAAEFNDCTLKMGGGFVFGAILTAIIAVADTLLTFLAPLKKYKVTVNDETTSSVTTTTTTTTTVSSTVSADAAPAADTAATADTSDAPAPAEAPAPAAEQKATTPAAPAQGGALCPRCGTPNPEHSKFCSKCGGKLY